MSKSMIFIFVSFQNDFRQINIPVSGEAMCPVQPHLRLKPKTTFMNAADAARQSAAFSSWISLSFQTGFASRFKTAAGFEARFSLSF